MRLYQSTGPVAECIRRVVASQLHQDRFLELLVIDRAGFTVETGIGGNEIVYDLFNVFATKTAEVMRNGEIAHQVVLRYGRATNKG